MERKALLEQQEQIKKMFSYKPGMTITENDKKYKQNIQEVAPLAVAGWALTAAWGAYEIWKWADNAWGEKSTTKRIKWVTQPGTYDSIMKRIKKTSIALGEDISGKLKIISNSKAGNLAENLHDAMYGGGTNEEKIRRQMDKCSSFLDLARVSDRFGKRAGWPGRGTKYDLWYWIDDELSQSDYKWSVYSPMKSKPLLIWDNRQYNDLEKFASDLNQLIADKEAQPGKDDARKKTIINSLVGKLGGCMKEYFEDATLRYDAQDEPYLHYKDGDISMAVWPNGRFKDAKSGKMGMIQKCEEVVTESVDSILKLDWVLGGLISEQFKIKYDDSEEIITIKDKEVVKTDDVGGEETDKTVEPVKPKWTLYTGDPTIKDEFVREWHFNKDAGSIIKQIQKILGIKEDGYFGKNTKKAVMDYQKEHGLKVDGGVGPETWAKMNETTETEVAGEELTVQDKNDVEKEVVKVVQDVQQNKVNVPTRREEIQNEVLGAQGNKKMQKNYCKNLIAFEAGMLKSNMEKATDLKALATCYNEYNFNAIGDNSKKVRKAYNLKKSGNPV